MNSLRAIVLKTGIAGGIAFVIHSSFPNVYSWPIMWPIITGAVAFWLATRLPTEHRLLTGLGAAVVAGVITGGIAFVGISIVAGTKIHSVKPQIQQSGVASGLVTAATFFAFAMIGVVDVAFAVIGGVLMLPVRFFQFRRAHA